MLTQMTEEDWSIAVEVFQAVRSKRGEPGHNDRKFLEALHYFTVHNITWRALPAEFGNWNSVWKRFWRLSQMGTFEAFSEALAGLSETAHLVQMFDSTIVRHMCRQRAPKGAARPGAWQIARRLFDKNPYENRQERSSHRFLSHRWRGQRQQEFRDAARYRRAKAVADPDFRRGALKEFADHRLAYSMRADVSSEAITGAARTSASMHPASAANGALARLNMLAMAPSLISSPNNPLNISTRRL